MKMYNYVKKYRND